MMKKIITYGIITIVVLYLLYLLNSLTRGNDIEPQLHLIPNNYIGNVEIYMNQEEGAPRKYEEDRRVYKIPESGLLKTQFQSDPGWIKNKDVIKYYYVDDSGKKIREIRNCLNCTLDSITNTNQIGVLGSNYITKGDIEILVYRIDTLYKQIRK